MADKITIPTAMSETTSIQTSTVAMSALTSEERTHCRGPLDGSLYARVKKTKKLENEADFNHVTEVKNQFSNHVSELPKSPTNHETGNKDLTNSKLPNQRVVVLNGNKVILNPHANLGFDPSKKISAPLANLSEFNGSCFSISSTDSLPSYSSVSQISVTSQKPVVSPAEVSSSPRKNMAEGNLQEAAVKIVDDVIKNTTVTKRIIDVTNQNARISEISSCSATTLSSTSTEDGGPHLELSDHDTSDSSITADQLETLEGNISLQTAKGSISPEILLEQALGDTEPSQPVFQIPEPESSAPPEIPPPAVPKVAFQPLLSQGVMYNGGVLHGGYNKGPEYAVPMRDMKITTIPSKRAVLVSTESENDNMASPSSERRDSVYDEGNTYNGAGYSTIEEYNSEQHTSVQTRPEEEHSYIPEDVQELLNGLQEGPTNSDIDSGFHGSSIALQTHPKSPNDHNNIKSQSSSELSDPFSSPPPSQSNEASPTYDGSYLMGKISPRQVSPVPSLPLKHGYNNNNNIAEASTSTGAIIQSLNVDSVPALIPKKNMNPGIPIPTQTLPEPQPVQVQIITMRNVYTNQQGVPLNPIKQDSPKFDRTKVSNTLQTQPSAVEYQPDSSKIVEKPPLPPHAASMETMVTMRNKQQLPLETVIMPTKADTVILRNKSNHANPVAMETQDDDENFFDDVEDQLDIENIKSVEEQIKHAQKHLQFLHDQQEKLVKRKEDRTRHRETLKRNSTAFESNSQAYSPVPQVSATLPRQPYKQAEEYREEFIKSPVKVEEKTQRQETTKPSSEKPAENNMPPITNVTQPIVRSPAQSQNVWTTGPKLSRQASDTSHNRYQAANPPLPARTGPRAIPKQDKDDIIMSSDLQEQLAELDRCIAELTTSMDVPTSPQDSSNQESTVVRRQKSFTLEIEKKMDPNIPQEDNKAAPVPNPPARSRSSFDSFKRLSQEFDINVKRSSFTEQAGNDDVFSPAAQAARKKKQSPFPPQTSVTRRQHTAPPPPPKRRISLEERLSPGLMQALTQNPGAKPKEDIHSYKEDLAPEELPDTPTFPLSPATPYVNTDSPGSRSKSPPGLAKTPLSMLHLKPTEKPMESLHHVDVPEKQEEAPQAFVETKGDEVDGSIVMEQVNNQQNQPPMTLPSVQAAVALQNGHGKETALLSDTVETQPEPQQVIPPPPIQQSTPIQQQHQQQYTNGQRHVEYPTPSSVQVANVALLQQMPQPQQAMPPRHLNLRETNQPSAKDLHGAQELLRQFEQQPPQLTTPQQYSLNHSGASHSSHSPAATSSNSRHGSSDSLDGPSTRHSNSSILSSSSSSSAQHPGMPMPSPGYIASPNNLMRPGSQMSNYERHLLPPYASGTRSGDESLGSPQSGRTSSSSISDLEKMNYDVSHATVSTAPKFIRDTTAYWYKPDITREQALAILRPKPAGSFIVRNSRCFQGAFGLALKVDKLPPNVQLKPGADIANEYIRHFLIEPSSRGVKLKGCPNEPVFGSLSALVYQHSITALALPCKLIIPTIDQEIPQPNAPPRPSQPEPAAAPVATPTTPADLLRQGAACNVIYIGSVDTESLTGPPAIERAVRETFQAAKSNPNLTSIVHFKVSPQGITLTDNARKLFFRRHYATETVTFCGLDPMGGANKSQTPRRWDATPMRGSHDAWLFGFVARKPSGSRDNQCHVFAELDPAQPARAIVNFVMKVLIGVSRQNSS